MVDIEEINRRLALLKEEQNKRTQINRVLDELYNIITTTQTHVYFWSQVYDMAKKRPEIVDLFGMFMYTSAALMIERMILDVAKIFDKSNSSVSYQHLINLIINEGKLTIERGILLTLKSLIKKNELKLDEHSDLINKLKFNRDKKIAHLDRSQIGADFDSTTKVEVDEIRLILNDLEAVCIEYYEICGYKKPASSQEHLQTVEQFNMSNTFDNLYHILDRGIENLVKEEQNPVVKSIMFSRDIRLDMESSN